MKYQRFAPSGCKYIGFQRFEIVAKTQFLCASVGQISEISSEYKYCALFDFNVTRWFEKNQVVQFMKKKKKETRPGVGGWENNKIL